MKLPAKTALVLTLLAPLAARAESFGTAQAQMGIGTLGELGSSRLGYARGGPGDSGIENDFGVSLTYEFFMHPSLSIGPRLAYAQGEMNNTENRIRTADAGLTARLFLNDGEWRGFATGALGVSYLGAGVESEQMSANLHGVGYHFGLGAGVMKQLTEGVGLVIAAGVSHQESPRLRGKVMTQSFAMTGEYRDLSITRPMFAAGVSF